jgi:hypothetical protein
MIMNAEGIGSAKRLVVICDRCDAMEVVQKATPPKCAPKGWEMNEYGACICDRCVEKKKRVEEYRASVRLMEDRAFELRFGRGRA